MSEEELETIRVKILIGRYVNFVHQEEGTHFLYFPRDAFTEEERAEILACADAVK